MERPTAASRPPLVTAAVVLLLALHWWLGVTGWFNKTVTSDETAHLVSGYSYWRFNDYRLQPENGNLPQRWGALPLLALRPHLDPDEDLRAWCSSNVWLVGQRFFFESGNNTGYMLALARATMALWSVGLGLLVFCWSRRLWGDGGGLLSLALFTFSPTTLAHGPLVTSDMVASFFLLAASGLFWRYVEKPDVRRLAASALATAAAVIAKFSFVVLVPIFFGLLLVQLWRRRGTEGNGAWLGRMAAGCALHVVTAWAVVWLCFGFRYSGFAEGLPPGLKYYIPWEMLVPAEGPRRWMLLTLKEWHLLPEAFVHGFAFVLQASQNRGAFLAGEYSVTGWWWFFPYAFAIKTSLTELAAFATAGVLLLRRGVARAATTATRFTNAWSVAPLAALLLVYGAISIASNLNIGHRHLLPIYPVLFIGAGALVRFWPGRGGAIAAVALVALAAFESGRARPHYLAFFNATAGGSENGWRHLVDSSLDWGQDLPALADWLRTHRQPDEKVYLSYFGMGDYRYEGIQAEPLAPYYQHYRPRNWRELEPGLYCLGATMLQNPYSEWSGEWTSRQENTYRVLLPRLREEIASGARTRNIADFGDDENHPLWALDRLRFARLCLYLRHKPVEASVNHTIKVFRLNAEELRIVVDGSAAELADLIESTAARKN